MNHITPCETRILRCIANAMTNKQIAQCFTLNIRTVEHEVYNLYNRLNIPEYINKRVWVAIHAEELLNRKYQTTKELLELIK